LYSRENIADNIIQFNNNRYRILTNNIIKRFTTVNLFYNDKYDDIFISYNNSIYQLSIYKNLSSKKGNSKYFL